MCFQETADGLHKLEEVSFLGSSRLTDDSFKALAETENIKRINIDSEWA